MTVHFTELTLNMFESWSSSTYYSLSKPQLESELESELESTKVSLEDKVLELLSHDPKSKSELSKALNQKQVSGPLHATIKQLLKEGLVEYTIPDKPQSRLQKYRLIDPKSKGEA